MNGFEDPKREENLLIALGTYVVVVIYYTISVGNSIGLFLSGI